MLRIEGLTVRYGRVAAVQALDLEVTAGEVVALVGPNGAGKTTTLAAIMGLVAPAAGAIELEGRSLLGRAPEHNVRAGLGLVPEGRQIFAKLTVLENLRLGLTCRRDADAESDLEQMLERFDVLRRYAASPAGQLSGGEQQQLAIARALLANPRLLLLDEPSLGLAPLMVDAVFEVLSELRSTGITVLLVEQNAIRATEFADRSYLLVSGRVQRSGTREQFASLDVAKAYLGVSR